MAKSDLFTIDMLIHYLNKHYDVQGVHDFLINRLYTYDDCVIMFYLPELCYCLVSKSTDSIQRYLKDKSSSNQCFYQQISWCVESFGFEAMRKKKDKREYLDNFLHDCENRMVNMKDANLDEMEFEELIRGKEARNDFKNDARKLITNLVNFSLHLKKIPNEAERKPKAQTFQKNINRWLYQRRLSDKKSLSESSGHLYEGILFPFSPTDGIMSNLITRVIYRECTCFNTKKRVPYRMVVETIDPKELTEHEPDFSRDNDFEHLQYTLDPNEDLQFYELMQDEKQGELTIEKKQEQIEKFDEDKINQLLKFANSKMIEEEVLTSKVDENTAKSLKEKVSNW